MTKLDTPLFLLILSYLLLYVCTLDGFIVIVGEDAFLILSKLITYRFKGFHLDGAGSFLPI